MMTDFGKRLDGPGGRRQTDRQAIILSAPMATSTASVPVVILDISATGAHVRAGRGMEVGSTASIRLPEIELFGDIVWVDGEHAGLSLDEPLDEETLDRIRARGKVTSARMLSPDEELALRDWNAGIAR